MTAERWLLERAVALLSQLMAERGRRPLVALPPEGATLEEVERAALVAALEATGWVQKRAAAKLGITARVMNYKMGRFRLHYDHPWKPGPPKRYAGRTRRAKPAPPRRRR